MIFDDHPVNLSVASEMSAVYLAVRTVHWVWDTGVLDHINRNGPELAAELERQITPRDRARWE